MGIGERGCCRKTNRRVGETDKGGNKTGRDGKNWNEREVMDEDKQESRSE